MSFVFIILNKFRITICKNRLKLNIKNSFRISNMKYFLRENIRNVYVRILSILLNEIEVKEGRELHAPIIIKPIYVGQDDGDDNDNDGP